MTNPEIDVDRLNARLEACEHRIARLERAMATVASGAKLRSFSFVHLPPIRITKAPTFRLSLLGKRKP